MRRAVLRDAQNGRRIVGQNRVQEDDADCALSRIERRSLTMESATLSPGPRVGFLLIFALSICGCDVMHRRQFRIASNPPSAVIKDVCSSIAQDLDIVDQTDTSIVAHAAGSKEARKS